MSAMRRTLPSFLPMAPTSLASSSMKVLTSAPFFKKPSSMACFRASSNGIPVSFLTRPRAFLFSFALNGSISPLSDSSQIPPFLRSQVERDLAFSGLPLGTAGAFLRGLSLADGLIAPWSNTKIEGGSLAPSSNLTALKPFFCALFTALRTASGSPAYVLFPTPSSYISEVLICPRLTSDKRPVCVN